MTNFAYLLPAARVMARLIEWENGAELHALMLGTLGAESLATTPPLRTPFGPIMLWSRDPAAPGAEINYFAMYVAEISGDKSVFLGDAIVTGANDGGGAADLSTDHLASMVAMSLDRVETGHDPSIADFDRVVVAMRRRDPDAVEAALIEWAQTDPGKANAARRIAVGLGILR